MFRFNHHHQGAYYLSFAKVIVIKIILLGPYRPNKICSHTTETTTTMYFN